MTFWDENYEPDENVPVTGTRVVFKENGYDRIASPVRDMDLIGKFGTVTGASASGLVKILADNRKEPLSFYSYEFEVLD